jgi:hypothetical protein
LRSGLEGSPPKPGDVGLVREDVLSFVVGDLADVPVEDFHEPICGLLAPEQE